MKKRDAILAVLAVILVLSASIGAASAYFTSYAEARAGYVVHMGYETVIDEDVQGNVKTVRITNQAGQGTAAGTYPVFVRVKVYYGSDCAVNVPETANWSKSGGNGSGGGLLSRAEKVAYAEELDRNSPRNKKSSYDDDETTVVGTLKF